MRIYSENDHKLTSFMTTILRNKLCQIIVKILFLVCENK